MVKTCEILPIVTIVDDVQSAKQGRWTAKDYPALPNDGQRYEILNGILYRIPEPGFVYLETMRRLSSYVAGHVRTARMGHAYTAPMYLELAPDIVVQPDFFVMLHREQDTIPVTHVIGTPDLVIEVASPGRTHHIWRNKYDVYARAGVKEYWIVQPEAKAIDVLILHNGSYHSSGLFAGRTTLCSSILPWFSLKVERLFTERDVNPPADDSDNAGDSNASSEEQRSSLFSENRTFEPSLASLPFLPPSYEQRTVSAKPMGSAPVVYTDDGQVAWNNMWEDYCEVALGGGPPHRGLLLEPVSPDEVAGNQEAYERVVTEIERGLQLVTSLSTTRCTTPGWVGLVCTNEAMALWLLRAIAAENVCVRREGIVLYLPAGPAFRVEYEIKNVITVVAKTHHYWTELAAFLYNR